MDGTLDVFLLEKFVGRLDYTRHHNEFAFAYDGEYLKDPVQGALSFSLPLREMPYVGEVAANYFGNLLPPEVVRKKLGLSLHMSRHNVFGFLKALGRDCAGAVSLYPEGETPPALSEEHVRELTEAEALDILKSLPQRPLYAVGEKGYRYSGAGAQDKLIVRVVDGKVVLPLDGTPSTHIIKPPAREFPDSVFNENFCQALAAEVGLTAAKSQILRLGGEPYYVTERYDRERVGGLVRRLHQEDFCQMLSVDQEGKYEEDGGPGIRDCHSILRKLHAPIPSQLMFLKYVIFNFLTGNADCHAKNYSVIYHGRKAIIAPLYDAVCTLVYPRLSKETAMRIGGDADFASVTRASFGKMAEECEIRPMLVHETLDEMAEAIVPAAKRLAEALSDGGEPSPVYAGIVKVIEGQIARVAA